MGSLRGAAMRSDAEREHLRQTFGGAAERYDRVRPSYPDKIVDEFMRLGNLGAGSRVLEIGCGTGQLTRSLVDRGLDVTAVELSGELAAVARGNLPEAEIIAGDFETWPLPERPFDAVVAATSFHWIDPAVQFTKTADALKPGGALGIMGSLHVDGGTRQFFVDVQECYERWDPEKTEPGLRLPAPDAIKDDYDVTRGGRFELAGTSRRVGEFPYRTSEYLDLLMTFSGHLDLPPQRQRSLLECIGNLIDERYGGSVTKASLFLLTVGRRVS